MCQTYMCDDSRNVIFSKMIRLLLYTVMMVVITSCVSSSKIRSLDLILYDDFSNPKDTYDSLRIDLMELGLVDSLKIIGRPIRENVIEIRLDTLRLLTLDFSLEVVEDEIIKIDNYKKNLNIADYTIANKSGREIPISEFSQMYIESNYYKPEIFITEPAVFFYNNSKVVKIELYCKKRNEKELTKFIMSTIPNYSYDFSNRDWRFEIVKSNKHYKK